ncbi:putative pectinesterase 29 [Castanea sativa]|uniref:putative pectinesterase 29 n=1 Tax=Castanea sativa TaxID=21020 RepID=UPI003F6547C6
MTTVIQWGDFGSSLESSTFKLLADNFMAREITFKNTFDNVTPTGLLGKITWAPAAFVQGDKVSFYSCSFISLQDTLTDWQGRHYFEQCYFEGAIDFIWGGGQSIYQNCVINVTESLLDNGNAYITAQARESDKETNGFVFKYCKVTGSGPAFLGRAYGNYSRVVFYKSVFPDFIAPQGWDAWNHEGKEEMITYAEIGCTGPGADMSKRVKWEKNLSEEEVRQLVRVRLFINQEMWMQEQLHALTISGPPMLMEK